jgi:hypothetical protein
MSRTSILVAFFMVLLISCEEGFITDCRDCNPDPVTDATLLIYIKDADYFPTNPLFTLYEGAIEDNIILTQYYVDGFPTFLSFQALLYKDYTATLEFTLDGQKYITVDAACPQVRYDETACDEPCYYIYDNIIDLRLRYR